MGEVVGKATRYFIQSDGLAKGPYDARQIRTSLRKELLTLDALVRAEDQGEFHPLRDFPALIPKPPSVSRLMGAYSVPESSATYDEDRGSFALGFVVGFFGGCIGLLILLRSKKDTQTGARVGFAAQLALGLMIKLTSTR